MLLCVIVTFLTITASESEIFSLPLLLTVIRLLYQKIDISIRL